MTLDLTDDEAAALAKHLRQKLHDERFPPAARLDPTEAILPKLAAGPMVGTLRPLKPGRAPSIFRGRRRR